MTVQRAINSRRIIHVRKPARVIAVGKGFKMAVKSIQRSLKLIKNYGWFYEITEHWNQYTRRRHDLWGFCDILCLDGKRTIAIQCCGADLAKHRDKIYENEYIRAWLAAGNELEIWSFTKRKKVRGKRATYWHCKVTNVFLFHQDVYFEEAEE